MEENNAVYEHERAPKSRKQTQKQRRRKQNGPAHKNKNGGKSRHKSLLQELQGRDCSEGRAAAIVGDIASETANKEYKIRPKVAAELLQALRHPENVRTVVEMMLTSRLLPPVSTLSIAINQYSKCRSPAEGIKLFHRLVQDHEIVPDLFMYRSVLSSCEKAKMTSEARSIFEAMQSKVGMNVQAYNVMVSVLGKCGEHVEAAAVLTFLTVLIFFLNSFLLG
jgi:pentatricopeptide repeat protein